jgi:hypothetical protein
MSGTQPPLPPPPSISCLVDVAARLAGRNVRESRPSARHAARVSMNANPWPSHHDPP